MPDAYFERKFQVAKIWQNRGVERDFVRNDGNRFLEIKRRGSARRMYDLQWTKAIGAFRFFCAAEEDPLSA